ncbi:RNA polymerase factor sigma-54 [Lactococcus chungangensis]|uniref:RNA polymerase factor sigma-54 n=1 Tax=Pseudolactococcus chungangensis TaxID=451457 RepID=UPI0037359DD4
MSSKPSINLKQSQSQQQKLAMTQTMQQAIQILHYSTSDLVDFLQEQSLENPLISVTIGSYSSDAPPSNHSLVQSSEDRHQAFLEQLPAEKISLYEHILTQIHLNYRDTFLRTLLIFLVDYLDSNGYLTLPLDAAAQTGASEIELLDALTLLQQLEPAGIGARNLQECLMLQTERDHAAPDIAYLLLEESFDDLVNRQWDGISQKYAVSFQEIQAVYDYIPTLTARPGAAYAQILAQSIKPDLEVTVNEQQLDIRSTKAGQPQITFQDKYYNRYKAIEDADLQAYLKDRKAEFEWLKTTVENRFDTILRVGREILTAQADFFLDNNHPLKPLTLKEIALNLDLHESTISRAVNQKYMRTPFGTYELKHFFPQGILQKNGESKGEVIANTAIKAELQRVIANENKQAPLSDQKIVEQLKQAGFDISRRTVVKYRDTLGIPTSRHRKRY